MPPKCMGITDAHGRSLRYLRLSVTDRCNLRCLYCVNMARQEYIPHDRILRYEEILRVARVSQRLGVRKARITGGEPLMRRDLPKFLATFRRQLPDMRLCLTTNALLLGPCLTEISALGLESFNISLDSFNRETFASITGHDGLPEVLRCVEALLGEKQRVKINAVALRGITDAQLDDFIYAIREYPVDLRFIEFMPMGRNTLWRQSQFISANELKTEVAKYATLVPAEADTTGLAGPAKMFNVARAKGRIGFIAAVSEHFCNQCNRLRLTSAGGLRACLFSDKEYDLSHLLRHKKISDEHIARVIQSALLRKPVGADILAAKTSPNVASAQMVGIGG